MYEALCRPFGTTLDTVHEEGGPPITQRTWGLNSLAQLTSVRSAMSRQSNQKRDEHRRIIESAAVAHIGWNVGRELWALILGAIKLFGYAFLLFCLFPILYGLFLVICGPSHPQWQGHTHIPVQEIGFVLILIGICGGFLTCLLFRAMWMAVRWFARKAGY